jgi:transposase
VWLPAKESHGTASQESPTPLPDGGLHQRVAFRTHPVQDESVEQPWQPGPGIAEIARRYEVSRGLLWNWRSQVRRGVLRPDALPVFLPVQTIREPANGDGVGYVEPSSARGTEQATDGRIEITLPDGTSIKVGHAVGLVTLRRVMTVLRR